MHSRPSSRAFHLLAAVLLLALPGAGCRRARPPAPGAASQEAGNVDPVAAALARISGWEDARTLAGGQLEALALKDAEPKVRARALRALGRMQLESTAATLVTALRDPAKGTRMEAAFAAGQLGLAWKPPTPATRASLVTAVLQAERTETEPELRLTLLEALSKLGTEPGVERLRERLSHEAPEVQARAALSLGLVAKRMPGTVPVTLVPLLSERLAVTGAWPLRYGAAYALSNLKRPEARGALLRCTKDPEAEIRALCAKGLRDTGTGKQVVPTLRALLADSDFRVAVEATRSLAAQADQCGTAPCPALDALVGLQTWVTELSRAQRRGAAQPLLALAQQGLFPRGEPLLRELRAQLQQEARAATVPAVKEDLLRLDCRFAAALDGQSGVVRHTPSCGDGVLPEELRLVRALEQVALRGQPAQRAARVKTLTGYLGHASPRVQMAALSALGGLAERGQTDPAVLTAVRPFLAHADPIVAANAAVIAGKLGEAADLPAIQALVKHLPTHPDLAGPLSGALVALQGAAAQDELRRWLEFPHLHVRNTAALALEPLTGAPVAVTDLPAPATLPAPPPKLEQRRVRLLTKKGAIELQLFDADSPRTAWNLVQLVKKGLYTGTRFHRVVPDFVVQGGDPRGDGEGGPGHTIRCEVSTRPYRPGTLGMALSGQDTGGSQLFLTQSPQPHLEGRYTAFGEVLSGQEVVDNLLEEDLLDGVELF